MPNLVYVSREKNKNSPHHFKAGALNSLLRVSGIMTNASIVLTQDCDMYSNDPQTLKRVLCYISDPLVRPILGYVQFSQCYHGLNNDDIYGGELLHPFVTNPIGMDGLQGPTYVGTGCFFLRRVFFGGPMSMVLPEIQELRPDHVVKKPITTHPIIELAHHVAAISTCNAKDVSLSFATRVGRPFWAISLTDVVSQTKRWGIGLLEVGFSKYTPVVFGAQSMGLVMGLCYTLCFLAHFVNSHHNILFPPSNCPFEWISHFPKDPWFLLYVFLFLGAYGQDCYDFILFNSTYKRWWNDQRMWLIRGLSPCMFGLVEYVIKHLGIATQGFNVTSKVQDGEQRKRYDQCIMDFGIHSPMFIPFTTASIVNLFTLIIGMIRLLNFGSLEKLFVLLFITGFGVLNSWPVYEAVILRSDKGRMSIKTIIISVCLASLLCGSVSIAL
ncbi:hypothetical protein L1987_02876 [Smallanthus sonchifolius]|uniref:Uncharacterized protein n=1 Tax=Smallanthus sonchifolius TaxID=185202 RepID=A0ACB9K8X8_9ASTR|nr:hypothetical protein L1987_02876 [Smallanthus sonchifolius]